MSNIVKAISALDLGECKLLRQPKFSTELFNDVFNGKAVAAETFDVVGMVAKRYRIEVRLGADAYIRDGDPVYEAIKRTKRQVIEAIFGEFRSDFREIEKAIYDYNYEEAGKLLYKMEHKMFEEYE